MAQAVEVFAGLGARVETVTLDLPDTGPIFRAHWFVGAATLLSSIPAEKHALIDPGLRAVAAEGAAIPLLDYTRATLARGRLGVTMNQFHQDWDLLLMPTLPIPAFDAGQAQPTAPDGSYWANWTPFSYPVQPDAAAGGQRALRPDRLGPADRPADRRPDVPGRAGAARRPRLRGAAPGAAAAAGPPVTA